MQNHSFLPSKYQNFVTSITSAGPLPSFDELCPRLLQHEQQLQMYENMGQTGSDDNLVFYASRGRGNRGRGGRGRGRGNRGGRNSNFGRGYGSADQTYYTLPNQQKPNPNHNQSHLPQATYQPLSKSGLQCKLCGKYNHTVRKCHQRYNHSY